MASLLLGRELLPLRPPELPQGPRHWFLGCHKRHWSLGGPGPDLLELTESQGTSLGMRGAAWMIGWTRDDLESKERPKRAKCWGGSQCEAAGPSEELAPGRVPVWLGWSLPSLAGGIRSMGEFPKAGPSAAAAPSCFGMSLRFFGAPRQWGGNWTVCSAVLGMWRIKGAFRELFYILK